MIAVLAVLAVCAVALWAAILRGERAEARRARDQAQLASRLRHPSVRILERPAFYDWQADQ